MSKEVCFEAKELSRHIDNYARRTVSILSRVRNLGDMTVSDLEKAVNELEGNALKFIDYFAFKYQGTEWEDLLTVLSPNCKGQIFDPYKKEASDEDTTN